MEIGKNAAPVEDDGLWMERKAKLKAKCTCVLRAVMLRMLVVMCVWGGGMRRRGGRWNYRGATAEHSDDAKWQQRARSSRVPLPKPARRDG